MGALLDRLKASLHWVLFLVMEVASAWLLFSYNSYQGSVWFTQANSAVGRVVEWESELLAYVNVKEQNDLLTQRNVELQLQLNALRTQLDGHTADTTMVGRLRHGALEREHFIPARVTSNSVTRKDNYLTINRGSADGVLPEMGVVSGEGVVGIVSGVTPHYARVMSVLNSKSNISCRLRGTNYFGYLSWHGTDTRKAYIDGVPHHARFELGDTIETSGYSQVFPQGLYVGRITKISDSQDGLAYELEVTMPGDLANVQSVCVIYHRDRQELDSLRRLDQLQR